MNPRVLVVDDSLTVRMDLAESFEGAGFEVDTAGTLEQAREAFDRAPFDVCVLDVLLPDGDGIAFLAELREGPNGKVPVMLLSSRSDVEDRVHGLRHGADEFVGKPYDPAFVVARARELVAESGAEALDTRPRVLVIDDSPTFRAEMCALLEGEGCAVLTAVTGEEGLRTAAQERPDLVIVDGVLPGIDGPTVIRRLRLDAALRRTPCVLLTGSEARAAELEALEAGADAFIRKGDEPGTLLARLGALRRSLAPQLAEEGARSLAAPTRLLAVDDSETYLHQLGDALASEGYNVVLARSGEEALELLSVQPVDCVLLDLVMPGLGGIETCRRIKGAPRLGEIPVVMLTAVERREAMIEGLSAGADDFIAKSSDLEVLRARIRVQLRRRQLEEEGRFTRERMLKAEAEASEARAVRSLAQVRAELLDQLERKNRELEAFSYSVSHDLKAPLRHVDAYSAMLLERYQAVLDDDGKHLLDQLRSAVRRMNELIGALLSLSRIGRTEMRREAVDLSAMARDVTEELMGGVDGRKARFVIPDGLKATGDPGMLRAVLVNLLGNALKFTGKVAEAVIELGATMLEGQPAFFVKDNGAGFDQKYAGRLFAPFQRLHTESEFTGSGIGLATVQRIIDRHGGRVAAAGVPGQGATFTFTLSLGAADAEPGEG